MLLLREFVEERRERNIDYLPQVTVGDSVPQEILRQPEFVAGLLIGGELYAELPGRQRLDNSPPRWRKWIGGRDEAGECGQCKARRRGAH
jgi:hypothetical protein